MRINKIMYFDQSVENVLDSLHSRKQGLSSMEADVRLKRFGPNRIKEFKKTTAFQIFIGQFNSFLIWILIAALVVSFILGEVVDAIVIAVIVILNAILGFLQEYRAEKSLEALRKLAALKSKVYRDNKLVMADSEKLVPGDVIELESGDKVPADARIIELFDLQVNESSLTGESTPVSKKQDIFKKAILAERANMVFSSTIVTRGKAKAVITATSMDTEIGKIAKHIQEAEEKLTPLQKKLDHIGKWLGVLILIICGIVFLAFMGREYLTSGALTGEFLVMIFLTAVSLAVAAVPEGLPAVVTISLALGVKRMVAKNSLVRSLPSVETLGSTNYICSDKTGTLTKNEMTVTNIFLDSEHIEVTGGGYKPEGEFISPKTKKKISSKALDLLLKIGILCNDSKLVCDKNDWKVIGDPTEGSLVVSATKYGLKRSELEDQHKMIDEIPFESERKLMTVIRKDNSRTVAYTKGAPDILLKHATHYLKNGKVVQLTDRIRETILKANEEMASNALRVLGFAYRELDEKYDKKHVEEKLVFVGLQGMIDPPREEAKAAIEKCKNAGITTIMITGDYKATAVAIAKKLGIINENDKVLTGRELDEMSDEQLADVVEQVKVYARTSPHHKVKILNALKKKDNIVAMTGDGVNDAPALKNADIGVAMGQMGTDVAKESSDMILLDDNFASIVNAVEEGRGIYDNIQKFMNYLLSCNIGEVLVVFISVLIGLPLPLIAVQLLWINLVTDGLPAVALGVDPISPTAMKRRPRKAHHNILNKSTYFNIFFIGFLICAATLASFVYGLRIDEITARSMAFTTLVVLEIIRVQMIRRQYDIGIFSNKYLILALASSLLLQLLVLYTPLNTTFKTVELDITHWIVIVATAAAVYIVGNIVFKLSEKLLSDS